MKLTLLIVTLLVVLSGCGPGHVLVKRDTCAHFAVQADEGPVEDCELSSLKR